MTRHVSVPLAAGQRQTLPRRLVWAALARLGPHCTAEEIAAELEAQHLQVPRSSVYRALDALTACGAIRQVRIDGRAVRYEAAGEPHQHAVCTMCNGVLHLEHTLIAALEEHLERDHRFQPMRTEVVVSGVCASCAAGQKPVPHSGTIHNVEHRHFR